MEEKTETTKNPKQPKPRNIRLQVTDWLIKAYDTGLLTKNFYTKLDSVYKGTYLGLKEAVPPEDLLAMWKMLKTKLDKIAEINRQKGKIMDNVQRVNYDLSIVISKYDSYKKWKEDKKHEMEDKANSKMKAESLKETMVYTNNLVVSRTKKEKDISSILDEI